MSSYCKFAVGDPLHGPYHDKEYGFPLSNDNLLFERLVLEINQAGLSWATILKKRASMRSAYDKFNIAKVAAYGEKDRQRLLNDAGIIRNRLKVDAAIANANAILLLQQEHGSFAKWLQQQHPLTKPQWVKLFKKTFKFTGGEITGEFLMSTGYLEGAHAVDCPVFKTIAKLNPPWLGA
ncbi:MAG: DNA-3-methyladenine glycosylase I [Pseudomonadales bacterium]